jgi:hypothetical protein
MNGETTMSFRTSIARLSQKIGQWWHRPNGLGAGLRVARIKPRARKEKRPGRGAILDPAHAPDAAAQGMLKTSVTG